MSNSKGAECFATDSDDEDRSDNFDFAELDFFWNDYVIDVHVDRGKYDDRELLQMQQVWLD